MSFLHSMQESIFFTTAPARCSCSVPAPLRLAACATPALHRRSSPLLACRADNTEAQVVAGDIGVAPELVAHLAVVGVAAPAAAVVAYAAVVGVEISEILVQICAPLPLGSAHVIQAVTVRLFLHNWMCLFFAIFIIPAHFI